jgi:ribonuclease HI
MGRKKQKYYVVWRGRQTGIYTNWDACKEQIDGYDGAQYKSFLTLESAEEAFETAYDSVKGIDSRILAFSEKEKEKFGKPVQDSLAVDAAYSTSTKQMEYQGVYTQNREIVFRKGPYPDATVNVGEFLALVHGLALLKKQGSKIPVYSDSRTAIAWVKKKSANSKMPHTENNKELFDLIRRAEKWLQENSYENEILKWETRFWGEIPADFGRK